MRFFKLNSNNNRDHSSSNNNNWVSLHNSNNLYLDHHHQILKTLKQTEITNRLWVEITQLKIVLNTAVSSCQLVNPTFRYI